jgi:hypothetical protein
MTDAQARKKRFDALSRIQGPYPKYMYSELTHPNSALFSYGVSAGLLGTSNGETMKLNVAQKLQTAFSAFRHRRELKGLLIRRFWQQQKLLEVNVQGICARFDTSDFLSNVFFGKVSFPAITSRRFLVF